MKTQTNPAALLASDVATASAVRQMADAFGSSAVVFGATDYHEGTIVHVNDRTRRVVLVSGGVFYVARRVHYQGASWLGQEHTEHSLAEAIRFAA